MDFLGNGRGRFEGRPRLTSACYALDVNRNTIADERKNGKYYRVVP